MLALQVLDLQQNNLTGTLPGQLSVVSQLRLLNLSNNNFTGTLPSNWTVLTSLRSLKLSRNPIGVSVTSI